MVGKGTIPPKMLIVTIKFCALFESTTWSREGVVKRLTPEVSFVLFRFLFFQYKEKTLTKQHQQ